MFIIFIDVSDDASDVKDVKVQIGKSRCQNASDKGELVECSHQYDMCYKADKYNHPLPL